jgi:hypothetical protein
MNIIRESLSNFAEVSKNFTNYPSERKPGKQQDETIEEDLEEDIPEVEDDGGSSSEEHKFEVVKK